MNYTDRIDLLNEYSQIKFCDYIFESTGIEVINEESKFRTIIHTLMRWAKYIADNVQRVLNKLLKPLKNKIRKLKTKFIEFKNKRLKEKLAKGEKIKYKHKLTILMGGIIEREVIPEQKIMIENVEKYYDIFISNYTTWIENGVPQNIIDKFESLSDIKSYNDMRHVKSGYKNKLDFIDIEEYDEITYGWIKIIEDYINDYEKINDDLEEKYHKINKIFDKLTSTYFKLESEDRTENINKILNVNFILKNYTDALLKSLFTLSDAMINCLNDLYTIYSELTNKFGVDTSIDLGEDFSDDLDEFEDDYE